MALDFPVGTDFPANGNQIPNGHEYDGFYWDSSAGVWKRLCEPDDPFDPTVIECVDDELTKSHGTFAYKSSGDTLTDDGVKGNAASGALASTLTELIFGTDIDITGFEAGDRLQLTNTTLDTPTDTFEVVAVDGFKLTVTYLNGDAATVYNTDDAINCVEIGGLQVNADCLFCEDDDRSICEEINLLQNQVIELEEEIDAIAPSVEYGTWEWQNPNADNATRPPAAGTFFLAKDGPGGLLDPVVTTQYVDTDVIVIHNNEYVPAGSTDPVDTHTWSDADDGKLIQLFDRADPDFFLGTILSTQVEADHVRIRVERVQTSGVPNDNADPDTGDFLTRINIFNAPSGGTASEFVLKSGDTMTGDLTIDRSDGGPTDGGTAGKEAALILKGDRTGTTDSVATIKFDNAASSYPGYLTYRSGNSSSQFFKFNQNVEFNNKDLSAINTISVKSDLTREGSKRITFQSGGGNTGNGTIIAHRPADLRRGFTIKGKQQSSNSVTGDVFYHYANSGSGGDSVDYTGICTSANHIMNRDHADGRYVQTGTKGIKITKSNGNYYIQG